jgi:hypothetical protein
VSTRIEVRRHQVSDLSLLFKARHHPLDLTLSISALMTGSSRRHHPPSPELIGTSLTPLRAPNLLHARLLVTPHLLNPFAADPTAADHQQPHGKRRLTKP